MSILNFRAIPPFQIPAPSLTKDSRNLGGSGSYVKVFAQTTVLCFWLHSLEYAPDFKKGRTNCKDSSSFPLAVLVL